MNYFLRNNETDFNRWYRHLVPYALVLLKAYEKDSLKLVFHNDEYHDLLLVKKQLTDIRASLDEEHLSFFREQHSEKETPRLGRQEGMVTIQRYIPFLAKCMLPGREKNG